MKKIIKRINLVFACIAMALVCTGLALFNFNKIDAKAANQDFYIVGASVRYMSEAQAAKNENGLRFVIAVSDALFEESLNATNTDFKDGVKFGGTLTSLANNETQEVAFKYSDFENGISELDGYMVAYLTISNLTPDEYGREYAAKGYYQAETDSEIVYTEVIETSMAEVASKAAAAETNAAKKAKLESYVLDYEVVFWDGEEDVVNEKIAWGKKIDASLIPLTGNTVEVYTWYADKDYTVLYDFNEAIKGPTNIYGVKQTVVDATDGIFKSLTTDYEIGEDANGNFILTHHVQNVNKKTGVAYFNVANDVDFEISMDVTLSNPIRTAAQGWAGANDRFGFAVVNEENNENYRYLMRSTLFATHEYYKRNDLYTNEGTNQKARWFVVGKDDPQKRGDGAGSTASDYFVLQDVSSLENATEISLTLKKEGKTLYAYNNKTIKGLTNTVNPYTSPLEKIWEVELA